MAKNRSLGRKMQLSFLIVSGVSIIVVTAFSLIYFYLAVKRQATENMREKLQIAELIYATRQEKVDIFAKNLAENSALQVLVDVDIRNKLSELVAGIVNTEREYQIIVFDESFNVFANVALEDHPLMQGREIIPISRNPYARRALSGQSAFGTEALRMEDGSVILAISASEPVYRDESIVGGILTRLILDGEHGVVREIAAELNVEAAIVESGVAVATTTLSLRWMETSTRRCSERRWPRTI